MFIINIIFLIYHLLFTVINAISLSLNLYILARDY